MDKEICEHLLLSAFIYCMKFEILQENLSAALSQALKFVSPKVQLPILSNFLLVAKEGVVKIFATDMENSISLVLGAKIEEEGEVAVSARILSDFVFAVPPGKISLEKEEDILKISSLKNKAKISVMPSEEFPKTDEESGGKCFFVDGSDSFSGLGPQGSDVLRESGARTLLTETGFIFESAVSAGDHHYGMIMKKPMTREG